MRLASVFMEKSSVSTKKTRFNFDAFCSSPASTLFFPLVIIIRADAKTLQHDRDLPTCSAGRGVCQPDHKLTSCWSLLANTERLCGLWLASPRPHGGSTLNVTVRLRNLQEGILTPKQVTRSKCFMGNNTVRVSKIIIYEK